MLPRFEKNLCPVWKVNLKCLWNSIHKVTTSFSNWSLKINPASSSPANSRRRHREPCGHGPRASPGRGAAAPSACSAFALCHLKGAQHSMERNFLPRSGINLEGNRPQPHDLNQRGPLQFLASYPPAPLSLDSTVCVYDTGNSESIPLIPNFSKSKHTHQVYCPVISVLIYPTPDQPWKIKISTFTLYICQVSIC